MVLDVGRTLRLWDRWSGSYGGFQGVARVIDLTRLADNDDDADFLRLVWTKPGDLDPRAKTEEVTKERQLFHPELDFGVTSAKSNPRELIARRVHPR